NGTWQSRVGGCPPLKTGRSFEVANFQQGSHNGMPLSNAERQRRWRRRHQLPTPEWCLDLLVIEGAPLEEVLADLDRNDPLYGAALEQGTRLEAAVEREGEEEE